MQNPISLSTASKRRSRHQHHKLRTIFFSLCDFFPGIFLRLRVSPKDNYESWLGQLTRSTGLALETYNQLAEAKPRTGPRSGPHQALGGVRDNHRHCRPGAARELTVFTPPRYSLDLSAPSSVVPKFSRTEIEEPGRRQDPVTAERGHSTQTGSFRRLQKRKEKKFFF